MHRCLEQLYPEITPIICLLRMHFVLSHQCKASLPSQLTIQVSSCPPPKSGQPRTGVMLHFSHLVQSAPRQELLIQP